MATRLRVVSLMKDKPHLNVRLCNNDRKFKMKFTNTCITFAGAIIVVMADAVRAQSATGLRLKRPRSPNNENRFGDQLFQAGKFSRLAALLENRCSKSEGRLAILQLGRIALLSNRLDDAQKWLQTA